MKKITRRQFLSATAVAGASAAFAACSSSDSRSTTTSTATTTTTYTAAADTDSGEIPSVTFYAKCIEYTSGPMMTDAMEAELEGIIDVESIQIDWSNLLTVVRTGIASNEPCDVYNVSNVQMANFIDMAVDLQPYLDADAEFAAYFTDAAIEACTMDGALVCLPWEINFPTILANKTVLDELGIDVPTSWTVEEFNAACDIMVAAGYYPFAHATDLNRGYWLYDNAIRSEVNSAGIQETYQAGELAYDSEASVAAIETVSSFYDNGYMYPGEGAVTVKSDEVKAAFYQGDLLMITEIAAGAKQVANDADFDVVSVPWPSSGSVSAINGVMNTLFIPQNSANIEAAVQVMKTYLSASIQAIHAEEGYIPSNVNAEITDPFVQDLVAQSDAMYTSPAIPTAVYEYLNNNLIADLVLNGGVDVAVENLVAAGEMA